MFQGQFLSTTSAVVLSARYVATSKESSIIKENGMRANSSREIGGTPLAACRRYLSAITRRSKGIPLALSHSHETSWHSGGLPVTMEIQTPRDRQLVSTRLAPGTGSMRTSSWRVVDNSTKCCSSSGDNRNDSASENDVNWQYSTSRSQCLRKSERNIRLVSAKVSSRSTYTARVMRAGPQELLLPTY